MRTVASPEDLAAWVSVHNAASPCWPVGADQIAHLWRVAADWTAEVGADDGRAVAALHVEAPHWTPGSRHAEATVIVARDRRRRGIGGVLWRRASRWAAARGLDGLDVWLVEGDADGTRFWGNRGFREVERERRSALEVAAAVAPPAPGEVPEGVRLTTVADSPGLERAVHRVAAEAMGDVPGSDAYDAGDLDHWLAGEFATPGMMPECGVIALAGDEVVGYALIERAEARPGVASHSMTGVARAWRGRGLATAMKREVIRRAHAAGIVTLEAENEARNAPMLAVNRRLGYRPIPDSLKLRGPLAPD